MHIHGWVAPGACVDIPITGDTLRRESARKCSTSHESKNAKSDIPRSELLKTIRKKIQSGFYNSDAVIEDIGHGFAQALDQTL